MSEIKTRKIPNAEWGKWLSEFTAPYFKMSAKARKELASGDETRIVRCLAAMVLGHLNNANSDDMLIEEWRAVFEGKQEWPSTKMLGYPYPPWSIEWLAYKCLQDVSFFIQFHMRSCELNGNYDKWEEFVNKELVK